MYKSSANIRPSRFVKITGDYTVAEAGAGQFPIGISQEFAPYAPIPSESTEYASKSGDPVSIYDGTEPASIKQPLLVIGAGGCTAGAYLKSGSNGEGIATSTGGDIYGAISLESGASGEAVRVQIIRGKV